MMKKLLISLAGVLAVSFASLTAVPTFAIEAADGARTTNDVEATSLEDSRSEDASKSEEIAPTFATELNESERSVKFKLGHSLILTGNNLTSDISNKTGIMLTVGNNLSLRTASEYSFLVGNTINFAGETVRDLYIVGNSVALAHDAKIGRDVFAAANTLTINTDIAGDLAVTADTILLKDVKIAGNLNLSVANVEFAGKVEVAGTLVYNDDANVTGLDRVKSGSVEVYHVEQIDQATRMMAQVYGQIMSIVALFLTMVIICAIFPRLHAKIADEATVGRFGTNLAIGLGILIAVPIVAIFAFFTLLAAPLGIIALALYLIAIYLAQGFAGAWLGYVIVEKLCKVKGNIFVEALIGIVILGLLSLVPYLGVITGFLGLLLGLGLIVSSIKPAQKAAKAKEAKQIKA